MVLCSSLSFSGVALSAMLESSVARDAQFLPSTCHVWHTTPVRSGQVSRVGTHDNIADLPSRNEYGALRAAGAQFVQPSFHESYESADAWAEFVRKCGTVLS